MTLREHVESRLAGLRETRLSCSWGARLDARINELEWVLMRMDLEGAVSAAKVYSGEYEAGDIDQVDIKAVEFFSNIEGRVLKAEEE